MKCINTNGYSYIVVVFPSTPIVTDDQCDITTIRLPKQAMTRTNESNNKDEGDDKEDGNEKENDNKEDYTPITDDLLFDLPCVWCVC